MRLRIDKIDFVDGKLPLDTEKSIGKTDLIPNYEQICHYSYRIIILLIKTT